MTRSVALLRGVNVGGRNKLPMKTFVSVLEGLGGRNVRTYIQSGNAVFDGDVAARDIEARIEAHLGFRTHAYVLAAAALRRAAERCPFAKQGAEAPKSVHLFLLDDAPAAADVEALGALKAPKEDFAVSGTCFYLLTPSGLTSSGIADKIDRVLKTRTTARNWNTVTALLAMAASEA